MSQIAVQFGAGAIGRGFLAQLYVESGMGVVFVDVSNLLVRLLNERERYEIQIVGPDAGVVSISGFRAVHGQDSAEVAAAVSHAAIVSTAVGAAALPRLAEPLAAGLLARFRRGGEPLNVILCENLHDAVGVLRNAVSAVLPSKLREAILERTGFVHAVVSRMVPFQSELAKRDDPLAISVEAYKRLPVDGAAIIGALPHVVGIEPVANFAAHADRKLYTHNCAHAVLGYIGVDHGHRTSCQALADPDVSAILDAVLSSTSKALVNNYGFSPADQNAHVADLLRRFANEGLGDTCRRLARDPIRKLKPDDRLVGAARLCEQNGAPTEALAATIASALCYSDLEDPSAVELQERIRTDGMATVLSSVCGIDANELLGRQVMLAISTRKRGTR